MRKLLLLLAITTSVVLTSCSSTAIDAGQEGVLIRQPYIFGSSGVDPVPLKTGRYILALSSDAVVYDIKPIKYTEEFDDVITADNNPVDFGAFIQIKVIEGQTTVLHTTKGEDWYENNIETQFRSKLRGYCSKYPMFVLTTDRKIVDSLELLVLQEMIDYTKIENIPVEIKQVIIGKVTPPKRVLDETIKTAAQNQARKTQDSRKLTEDSRKAAEHSKAIADMEYKNTFRNMTIDQYLSLRALELENEKVEMIKHKKNVAITFIQGNVGAVKTIK